MCPKEGLPCLEDHLVVYFKQLINEEPCAISTQLRTVSILEHPVAILKGYTALLPGQRIIVKFNIAIRHTPNADDARVLREGKDLISLWTVEEL